MMNRPQTPPAPAPAPPSLSRTDLPANWDQRFDVLLTPPSASHEVIKNLYHELAAPIAGLKRQRDLAQEYKREKVNTQARRGQLYRGMLNEHYTLYQGKEEKTAREHLETRNEIIAGASDYRLEALNLLHVRTKGEIAKQQVILKEANEKEEKNKAAAAQNLIAALQEFEKNEALELRQSIEEFTKDQITAGLSRNDLIRAADANGYLEFGYGESEDGVINEGNAYDADDPNKTEETITLQRSMWQGYLTGPSSIAIKIEEKFDENGKKSISTHVPYRFFRDMKHADLKEYFKVSFERMLLGGCRTYSLSEKTIEQLDQETAYWSGQSVHNQCKILGMATQVSGAYISEQLNLAKKGAAFTTGAITFDAEIERLRKLLPKEGRYESAARAEFYALVRGNAEIHMMEAQVLLKHQELHQKRNERTAGGTYDAVTASKNQAQAASALVVAAIHTLGAALEGEIDVGTGAAAIRLEELTDARQAARAACDDARIILKKSQAEYAALSDTEFPGNHALRKEYEHANKELVKVIATFDKKNAEYGDVIKSISNFLIESSDFPADKDLIAQKAADVQAAQKKAKKANPKVATAKSLVEQQKQFAIKNAKAATKLTAQMAEIIRGNPTAAAIVNGQANSAELLRKNHPGITAGLVLNDPDKVEALVNANPKHFSEIALTKLKEIIKLSPESFADIALTRLEKIIELSPGSFAEIARAKLAEIVKVSPADFAEIAKDHLEEVWQENPEVFAKIAQENPAVLAKIIAASPEGFVDIIKADAGSVELLIQFIASNKVDPGAEDGFASAVAEAREKVEADLGAELARFAALPKTKVTIRHSESLNGEKELYLPGLAFQTVSDNGNCFYEAIAAALGSTTYQELRTKAADHLAASEQDFINVGLLTTDGKITVEKGKNRALTEMPFIEYVNNVRNAEWADEHAIVALSKSLNRPIYVIGPEGEIFNKHENLSLAGDPLFVFYNGENHYEALITEHGVNAKTTATQIQLFTELNKEIAGKVKKADATAVEKGIAAATKADGLVGEAVRKLVLDEASAAIDSVTSDNAEVVSLIVEGAKKHLVSNAVAVDKAITTAAQGNNKAAVCAQMFDAVNVSADKTAAVTAAARAAPAVRAEMLAAANVATLAKRKEAVTAAANGAAKVAVRAEIVAAVMHADNLTAAQKAIEIHPNLRVTDGAIKTYIDEHSDEIFAKIPAIKGLIEKADAASIRALAAVNDELAAVLVNACSDSQQKINKIISGSATMTKVITAEGIANAFAINPTSAESAVSDAINDPTALAAARAYLLKNPIIIIDSDPSVIAARNDAIADVEKVKKAQEDFDKTQESDYNDTIIENSKAVKIIVSTLREDKEARQIVAECVGITPSAWNIRAIGSAFTSRIDTAEKADLDAIQGAFEKADKAKHAQALERIFASAHVSSETKEKLRRAITNFPDSVDSRRRALEKAQKDAWENLSPTEKAQALEQARKNVMTAVHENKTVLMPLAEFLRTNGVGAADVLTEGNPGLTFKPPGGVTVNLTVSQAQEAVGEVLQEIVDEVRTLELENKALLTKAETIVKNTKTEARDPSWFKSFMTKQMGLSQALIEGLEKNIASNDAKIKRYQDILRNINDPTTPLGKIMDVKTVEAAEAKAVTAAENLEALTGKGRQYDQACATAQKSIREATKNNLSVERGKVTNAVANDKVIEALVQGAHVDDIATTTIPVAATDDRREIKVARLKAFVNFINQDSRVVDVRKISPGDATKIKAAILAARADFLKTNPGLSAARAEVREALIADDAALKRAINSKSPATELEKLRKAADAKITLDQIEDSCEVQAAMNLALDDLPEVAKVWKPLIEGKNLVKNVKEQISKAQEAKIEGEAELASIKAQRSGVEVKVKAATAGLAALDKQGEKLEEVKEKLGAAMTRKPAFTPKASQLSLGS